MTVTTGVVDSGRLVLLVGSEMNLGAIPQLIYQSFSHEKLAFFSFYKQLIIVQLCIKIILLFL